MRQNNRIKTKIIGILIILNTVPGFSQYFNHDHETDELKKLYSVNSIIFPSSSYPISRQQLIIFAENLDEKVSDPGNKEKIKLLISKLKESDTIGIRTKATASYNYMSKEMWPDYYRNFFEIPPVFDIYIMLCNEKVAIETGETWRREYKEYPESNLPEYKEGDFFAAENQFLSLGLLSYQFDGMEILIGRAPVHFGDPDFNSLLPSDRLPFLDMVEIKIPIGPFELVSQISTLENREAIEDDYKGDVFEYGLDTIMTAMHRFEYRRSRLRASVAGFSVISRPGNGFMLGDVFPVFAWHTADVGWHNLSLIGDISFIPLKGVNVFFQTGFDDINASDLFGINDSEIPTVAATILGISYYKELDNSGFSARLEFGKTHYLWGNFYGNLDSEKDGDHYFEKSVYRVFMDNGNRILPLTSPYGPGAFWGEVSAGIYNYNDFNYVLKLFFLSKNTEADCVTTPFIADDDVENGVVDLISNISLMAKYAPHESFEFFMEPGLLVYNNEVSMEFTVGATLSFSRFGKY